MNLLISATGASGSALTHTLITYLRKHPTSKERCNVSFIATKTACLVSQEELGFRFDKINTYVSSRYSVINCYPDDSFYAPPSSGSTFNYDAFIVIPASMGFLARCANGISSTLSERAFDVALKEKVKIIVVPREMPFSTLHIETLLKLSKLGVIVCPPCISYYGKPETVQDITNNVVGKVLKLAGLENNLYKKWTI